MSFSSPETTSPAAPPWTSRLIALALMGWILLVITAGTLGGWGAAQVTSATGGETPGWLWMLLAAGQGTLVSLPAAALAYSWKQPRYRALFQFWALAGLYPLLLAPIHLPPSPAADLAGVLQLLLSLVFIVILWFLRRRRDLLRSWLPPAELLLSLALPAVLALPWLEQGALGSPLDTGLNLLVALAFGLATALLVDTFWLRPFYATADDGGLTLSDLTLAGFVTATGLLVMASGAGFDGQQLLLALLVPSTAWAIMALSRAQGNLLPLTLLIGLTAAIPFLLVDPRELAIAAAFGLFNLLSWAFGAAFLSTFLGWILGALLLFLRWLLRQRPQRAPGGLLTGAAAIILLIAWMTAGAVYLTGSPGFYGDQLFVVLAEQADVSEAVTYGGDLAARRQFVYETLVAHATSSQADLRQALNRFGIEATPYYLVNGLAVEGGPLLASWLENRPEVDRVLYNPMLRPLEPETDSLFPSAPAPTDIPWNLSLVGADRVWQELGVTGEGIVIGQSDSGAQWDHPELRDSYRGGPDDHDYNWFDPWYGTQQPIDTGGHGTHTLGTVLGNQVGVAPDAQWFACANLARNLGNSAYYLDCMQFMLAPFPLGGDPFRDGDPALGADILNNSWGCPALEGCDPSALEAGVNALRNAGMFVVVSAGNDGPDCGTVDSPPAIYDSSFSVGAINSNGELAPFSSRGPVVVDDSNRIKPDIVAPGVDILSATPGNTYKTMSGTSMAGPHVAGVVALLWDANPDLIGDIDATEQILVETAQPFSGSAIACGSADLLPTNTYGWGVVDAYAAVREALDLSR